MIVSFVSAIEVTIVATAMPTIVGALGDFDLFSWVFTAYLLTQGVTVPIYGRLCDFYGRKRMLYFGLVFFVLGSLLCGFAWSMPTLIAFRVVQGLGGGVARDRVADHGQRSLSAGRARQGAGLYLQYFRNLPPSSGRLPARSSSRIGHGHGCSGSTCRSARSSC